MIYKKQDSNQNKKIERHKLEKMQEIVKQK